MNPTILTYTGRVFNLVHPEESEFVIEDIAHALGNLCRFTGHTSAFYSVAEHSFHVSTIVPKEHQLAALLHDGAEAYLGDVSSPLKALLPEYRAIERKVECALLSHFGLAIDLPPCVKHADYVMLATERRDLMPSNPLRFTPEAPARTDLVIRPWHASMAEAFFLERFRELTS